MNLGELFYSIRVKTDSFQKDLQSAQKQTTDSTQKMSSKFSSLESSIKKAGIAMLAAFTARAIMTGLAEMIKLASDAEETFSKFSVVFKDVSAEAEKTFKTLRDEYGLSSKAAKQLLSDTGDLLTGFGFTGKEALRLSGDVNKLAVDLASFTNFSGGAAGASAALTKALLGERESVKALGISILEEDVKKQMAINTAKGLIFETERQAKAQATLDLAIQQSKNSIGDYNRTSESAANQSKLLKERFEDLSVTIGGLLLPAATNATRGMTELVNATNSYLKDVFTDSNMKGLEKFVRLTGASILGILSGGKIGKGISNPVFLEAWEAQAEAALTPLEKVNKEIYKLLEEKENTDNAAVLSRLNGDINRLIAERIRLTKEAEDAAATATAEALKAEQEKALLAAKIEGERRAALGKIGQLQEDVKNMEAGFIAANSDSERHAWSLRKYALEQELARLQEIARIRLMASTGTPVAATSISARGTKTHASGLKAANDEFTLPVTTATDNLSPMVLKQISNVEILNATMIRGQQAFTEWEMAGVQAGINIGNSLMQMAADGKVATSEIIKQLIAQITGHLIASIMSNPAILFPANIAFAAGAGLFAGSLINTIPAFASGAKVDSPTLAMFGEYPGASTNPEYALRQDQLKTIAAMLTSETFNRLPALIAGVVPPNYNNNTYASMPSSGGAVIPTRQRLSQGNTFNGELRARISNAGPDMLIFMSEAERRQNV